MRYWELGSATPYTLSIFARIAYLCVIFFMPESLTPEKRKLSAVNTDADDLASTKPATPLLTRLLAAPKELVEPFRILLPEEVNGRRDYKLLLVASSYFFLMVIPVRTARRRRRADLTLTLTLPHIGSRELRCIDSHVLDKSNFFVRTQGPVKVLYARAKFGWAPEQIGQWITYTSLCKLVVLTAIVPLMIRLLRHSKIVSGISSDEQQPDEAQPLLGTQPMDGERMKQRRANLSELRNSTFAALSASHRRLRRLGRLARLVRWRHDRRGLLGGDDPDQATDGLPLQHRAHSLRSNVATGTPVDRAHSRGPRRRWQGPRLPLRSRNCLAVRHRTNHLRSGEHDRDRPLAGSDLRRGRGMGACIPCTTPCTPPKPKIARQASVDLLLLFRLAPSSIAIAVGST